MKKVLITGANGLLGQHLGQRLSTGPYEVIATGRGPSRLDALGTKALRYESADLTNAALVEDLVARTRPDFIVHAGAMTQVDDCERNQDACFGINVQSTAQLLVAAEQYGAFFIFLSTDFVFDGQQGHYQEDDAPNPLSWYGFTKVQAESTVEISELPWAIVRTCLVYGESLIGKRSNIITWVKSSLEKGEQIKVVGDQVRTPTFVGDLVDGISRIIERSATGIFHISGEEVLTPYDMAIATARYFSLDETLIERVDASTFSQVGTRPLKTGFNISKARHELGYAPVSLDAGLRRMFPISSS